MGREANQTQRATEVKNYWGLTNIPKCLYFVGGVLTKLIFRTVMEIGKAAADSYA